MVWVVTSFLQWDPNSVPTASTCPLASTCPHIPWVYCYIPWEELFPVWSAVSLAKWPLGKDLLNELVRTSQLSVWYPERKPSAIKLSIRVQSTYIRLVLEFHLDLWQGNFHVFLFLSHCSKYNVHHPLLSQFNQSILLLPLGLTDAPSHQSLYSLLLSYHLSRYVWKPPVRTCYIICRTQCKWKCRSPCAKKQGGKTYFFLSFVISL